MPPTPAATTTERTGGRRPVVRDNLATRALHGATALGVAVLLATGWWLWSGREGRPSVISRLVDEPDVEIHRSVGWALVVLAGLAMTLGVRGWPSCAGRRASTGATCGGSGAGPSVPSPAASPGTRASSTRASGSPTCSSS